MKQIRLKDKILKIECCRFCPCAWYEHHNCQASDHVILFDNQDKIHPDCPLEDYQEKLKE